MPEPQKPPRDEARLAERLLEVLRARAASPSLGYVEPLRFLAAGNEASVYGFRVRGSLDFEAPLVLRLLKPRVDAWKMRHDEGIHAGLAELGFPAPRILYSEEKPQELGERFQVMTRILGAPLLEELLHSPIEELLHQPLRLPRLVKQALVDVPRTLASIQARLHELDPGPVERELVARGFTRDEIRQEGRLDRLSDRVRDGEFAQLMPVLDWLRRQRPTQSRLSICHRDLLFTNVGVDQGRVTGVFDWSNATLADPAFDVAASLARLRSGIPGLPLVLRGVQYVMQRRYLSAYRRHRSVDPEALRYYEVHWTLSELLYGLEHGRQGLEPTGLVVDRWLHPEVQAQGLRRLAELTGREIPLVEARWSS